MFSDPGSELSLAQLTPNLTDQGDKLFKMQASKQKMDVNIEFSPGTRNYKNNYSTYHRFS